MKPTKQYHLISRDRERNLIFIASPPGHGELDVASAFRQIESVHWNKANHRKPWRVIYRDTQAQEWEISLDPSRWPRSYANWDRRFNPEVQRQRWHGVMWDTLKNSEAL
jgi:hypothetical protein